MIDMRMRQQHEVQVPNIKPEIKRPHILLPRIGPTLKHAAIDKETATFSFHQKAGASDLTCRAKKAESHVLFTSDLA